MKERENKKFLFFEKKQKTFIPPVLLLKWLFDTHERKHLILFRRKKTMSFCGHNFTFECWKCWLFLRQDCGKGKPWNHFPDFAIQSLGQKQFRALCEKWQDLHWTRYFYSQKVMICRVKLWYYSMNGQVFAHKYPPKYLGWEGSVLGDGDWKYFWKMEKWGSSDEFWTGLMEKRLTHIRVCDT